MPVEATAIAKILLYCGTAIAVGVAITGRDPRRLGAVAAACVGIGPLIWLDAQRRALEFSVSDIPVLLGTAWGVNWVLLAVSALLAATGFHFLFHGQHEKAALFLVRIGALALAATLGGLGHANADDRWPLAARVLDAAHVLAMGAWVGVLLLAVYRTATGTMEIHERLQVWKEVSMIAIVAAPLAFATGVLSALRVLGAPNPSVVLGSTYGRLLMPKMLLVLGMIGLGALHHLRIRSGRMPNQGRVRLEVLLAGVVVVLTAVLTGTSPPE